MNETYAGFIDGEPPARSAVEAANLLKGVEIEAIAASERALPPRRDGPVGPGRYRTLSGGLPNRALRPRRARRARRADAEDELGPRFGRRFRRNVEPVLVTRPPDAPLGGRVVPHDAEFLPGVEFRQTATHDQHRPRTHRATHVQLHVPTKRTGPYNPVPASDAESGAGPERSERDGRNARTRRRRNGRRYGFTSLAASRCSSSERPTSLAR